MVNSEFQGSTGAHHSELIMNSMVRLTLGVCPSGQCIEVAWYFGESNVAKRSDSRVFSLRSYGGIGDDQFDLYDIVGRLKVLPELASDRLIGRKLVTLVSLVDHLDRIL